MTGHRSNNDLVCKLHALPAAHRLDRNLHIAELPVPARLAFEAGMLARGGLYGFAVGRADRGGRHRDAEAILQPVESDGHSV